MMDAEDRKALTPALSHPMGEGEVVPALEKIQRLRTVLAYLSDTFQSARGLAQSKTWRIFWCTVRRVSVLECAGPPALLCGHQPTPEH